MRYAVVSDLHANLPAWQSVLADLQVQGVDMVVCLGDVVGYGPNPAEVLQGVRQVSANFVIGNHDAAAVGRMDYSIFNDNARHSVEWTAAQLDEEAGNFLREVPLAIDAGEILFVHGEILDPGRFHYINDVDDARENFAKYSHLVTFLGHTHIPKGFEMDSSGEVVELEDQDMVLNPDNRYIINVGSVGEPRSRDDLRARYVLYDSERREVVFRRVPFDIESYRRNLDATTLQVRPFFLAVYEEAEDSEEVLAAANAEMLAANVLNQSGLRVDPSGASLVATLREESPVLRSARASRVPMLVCMVLCVLTAAMIVLWRLQADRKPADRMAQKELPQEAGILAAKVDGSADPGDATGSPEPVANDGEVSRIPLVGVRMKQTKELSKEAMLWSKPGNWVGGKVPSGSDNVILDPGVRVQVRAKKITDPPRGMLVLGEKSVFQIFTPGGHAVLPTKDSRVIMHDESLLIFRPTGETRIGRVELIGHASIMGGFEHLGHDSKRIFTLPITGEGRLTLRGATANTFVFKVRSTFQGGLVARTQSDQQPFHVVAAQDGCLGLGPVVVGPWCSLLISHGLSDVIADDAKLTLAGAKGDLETKLVLQSNERVGGLTIDGEEQADGVFSAVTHPKLIAGNGTLTVQSVKKADQ